MGKSQVVIEIGLCINLHYPIYRIMKKADAGRHQPFSYSYEEENKLRCLGSLIIGESVFIHDYTIQKLYQ